MLTLCKNGTKIQIQQKVKTNTTVKIATEYTTTYNYDVKNILF